MKNVDPVLEGLREQLLVPEHGAKQLVCLDHGKQVGCIEQAYSDERVDPTLRKLRVETDICPGVLIKIIAV